jgi:L-alanine-DL-glutamate epimerase-like enolase superfamily enzyme
VNQQSPKPSLGAVKIRKIVSVPLLGESPKGGWSSEIRPEDSVHTLVAVHTDSGITGYGSAFTNGGLVAAALKVLEPIFTGENALEPERVTETLHQNTFWMGRGGTLTHAISAIDIALWDLRGKVEGKPVSELLGTKQRDRLLAYGTVYPLGETPDEVRFNIDRGLKRGLKAIKIVADPHWRHDLKKTELLIRSAREHVGPDIKLMCDAATAWTEAEQGLPLVPIFRDNGFLWLEAPLPIDDLAGHARFAGQGVPIGGGDLGLTTHYEYETAFDVGKIDIAQPDVTMAGGLTELMRIAASAKARGKRVVTHGYKSNITIAANLAFLSQHWADEPAEYSTSESPLRWELTNERFDLGPDGKIEVPTAPGLGVSLNQKTIDKYRVG